MPPLYVLNVLRVDILKKATRAKGNAIANLQLYLALNSLSNFSIHSPFLRGLKINSNNELNKDQGLK